VEIRLEEEHRPRRQAQGVLIKIRMMAERLCSLRTALLAAGLILLSNAPACGGGSGRALTSQELFVVEQGKANTQQKNTLVIRFHDGRITAQSPTLNYEKQYAITEAYDMRFALTSPGNSGLPYTSKCQFMPDGNKILFRAETDPLRGEGLLERVGY
jgi:hypothetical protein